MAAYAANSSSSSRFTHHDLKSKFSPEMMAMLPPQAKIELQKALDMTKALQEVPEENRTRVRPYMDAIDLAFLKAEGKIKTLPQGK
jgi:hypothetical protein